MELKRVLIVDDVSFVRKTLRQILEPQGYEIAGEATNGEEALRLYRQLKPDLVTMDIVMPVLGGIEATRQIMKQDKDAKIVIISAMGQESLVMEAINAGARDFILKPFKAVDILRAFQHILSSEVKIAQRAAPPERPK